MRKDVEGDDIRQRIDIVATQLVNKFDIGEGRNDGPNCTFLKQLIRLYCKYYKNGKITSVPFCWWHSSKRMEGYERPQSL